MRVKHSEELYLRDLSPDIRECAEAGINREAHRQLGHWNFTRIDFSYRVMLEAEAEILDDSEFATRRKKDE